MKEILLIDDDGRNILIIRDTVKIYVWKRVAKLCKKISNKTMKKLIKEYRNINYNYFTDAKLMSIGIKIYWKREIKL